MSWKWRVGSRAGGGSTGTRRSPHRALASPARLALPSRREPVGPHPEPLAPRRVRHEGAGMTTRSWRAVLGAVAGGPLTGAMAAGAGAPPPAAARAAPAPPLTPPPRAPW